MNCLKFVFFLMGIMLASCGRKETTIVQPERVIEKATGPTQNNPGQNRNNGSERPEGATTSSGGDGIVCRDPKDNSIKSVHLYDFIEMEELANKKIFLEGKDFYENLQIIVDRLTIDVPHSDFADYLNDLIKIARKEFAGDSYDNKYFSFINQGVTEEAKKRFKLKPIHDDGSPIQITKEFCHNPEFVQIAVTNKNYLGRTSQIQIDWFYFNKMNEQDKSGLLGHEFLVMLKNLVKMPDFEKLKWNRVNHDHTRAIRELVAMAATDTFGMLPGETTTSFGVEKSKAEHIRKRRLDQLFEAGLLTKVSLHELDSNLDLKCMNLFYNDIASPCDLSFFSNDLEAYEHKNRSDDGSTTLEIQGTIGHFNYTSLKLNHFVGAPEISEPFEVFLRDSDVVKMSWRGEHFHGVELKSNFTGEDSSIDPYSDGRHSRAEGVSKDTSEDAIEGSSKESVLFPIVSYPFSSNFGKISKSEHQKNENLYVSCIAELTVLDPGSGLVSYANQLGCLSQDVAIDNEQMKVTLAKGSPLFLKMVKENSGDVARESISISHATIKGVMTFKTDAGAEVTYGQEGKCSQVYFSTDNRGSLVEVRRNEAYPEFFECPKLETHYSGIEFNHALPIQLAPAVIR